MRNPVIGSFVGFMLGAMVLAACGGSSVSPTAPLEARIAELESVVAELCAHITKDPTGKLTISAPAICIESDTTIDIRATGQLKVDGAVIQLNGGTRTASGAGDATNGSMVLTGAPSVLIP